MSEWISVKDRLPEIGVEVLICDVNGSNGFRDVWSLELDEEYGDVCWEGKDGCWYSPDSVTHWMSLPEPPEEVLP